MGPYTVNLGLGPWLPGNQRKPGVGGVRGGVPQFLHSTRRGVAEGLGAGLAPPPRFFPRRAGDANPRRSEEGLSAQAPGSGRVGSNPSLALTTVTLDLSFPLGPSSLSLSFPIFPEEADRVLGTQSCGSETVRWLPRRRSVNGGSHELASGEGIVISYPLNTYCAPGLS